MGRGITKDALAAIDSLYTNFAIDSLYIRCKFKSKKLSSQQPKAALKLGSKAPD